jgi:pseudouridine-5'-phosphate glycosidase
MVKSRLSIASEVQEALKTGKPVVALESTIVAHGMPYPQNLETAKDLEAIIRDGGATPATIAVINGKIQVGCDDQMLYRLATESNVAKVSRRDLPMALANGDLGATTVSGTLIGAELAGIRVFVTGGIGGVHRGVEDSWDVSADLPELSRAQVAVVCAGAKSILDLPKTLESLETNGVTVLGYQTDFFPAFFVSSSGLPLLHRAEDAKTIARAMDAKWSLDLEGAILVANPVPEDYAADAGEISRATSAALALAEERGVTGKDVTPFLLREVARITGGESLKANRALVANNARLGASLAVEYATLVGAQ